MFVSFLSLSLATSLFAHSGAALDIDVKDQDSIKSAAKTIASGIVKLYNSHPKDTLTPGLFSDPYYWWEAGAVFGTLVDYSFLTGDSQYDDLLGEGLEHQIGEFDAFMPVNQTKNLGSDDQSTWGLAAMSAAENGFSTSKIGNLTWAQLATNVFDTQVQRWNDKTCDGGLNWQIYQFNNGYTYKNAISTGNFFLLATRLAKFTGNATYSEWAEKAFDWSEDIGLVDDYLVYDGASETTNCTQVNRIQWSNNNGLYLEAAAHMWNVTKGDDKWKKAVTGLVNTTVNVFVEKDVLTEVACEKNGKCNVDQKAFKGLAVRSYARAIASAPFISESLAPVLEASAKAAAKGCSEDNGGVKCQLRWTAQGEDAPGALGEAFSALAVVQALLVPEAKPLATGSSSNGTSTGSSTQNAPAASGSGKPAESEGGADALFVSRSLVVVVAALAVAFL
ncbi:glycoside hydrolase family 76 protein [Karstenula rhodostoma CBS 690.94]|uniref:Mannan endo-1,6-alpha-mannosidase n=1 Tax=Karstenula rhodostoma CBS 690.94 TaxID=1392251 RepID=A0A9P4PUL2_9PLEO|nr:glycoside hydrolase family 76 protein [Karstenula rhodostoma CBS 690.94]